MPSTHPLLTLRHRNSESYKVSELGSGTMGFVKQVFDDYFGLREEAKFSHARDLRGNDLLDHIYTHEGSKRKGAKARRDFMLKMNGKKIVVEVEAYGGMDKGMKQIQGYMDAEDTPYAIVTDSWTWRFFKHGYSETDYEEWTLEDLLSDQGKSFLDTFYNTYEYYLHRLRHLQTQDFDIQAFHTGLITIAEALVSDFRFMGLFAKGDDTAQDKQQAKREIQTAYSLIIQFLLIKIIQNKRKIALIDVTTIISHLENQQRAEIYEEALSQIDWLGEFYKSYHNQQQDLIDKILSQFRTKFGTTKFTLDAVRPFLDLYQFIFSFDFGSVTQDLFGAVYENYLKELYKDDDTKKGQVFTPPEIVDFMLDEIGYTSDYIVTTIKNYGLDRVKSELDPLGNFNLPGLSLIDPACGSGTFLYKAATRVINAIYTLHKQNLLTDLEAGHLSESLIVNNIVGFDIEAFPLYLAEMNILQTLLFFNINPRTGEVLNPIDKAIKIFSTDDSIAEFADIEQSMIRDLTDIVENEAFASSLFRKRDNNAIVQLKADIQDFDPAVIIDRLQLQYGLTEIQRPVYLLTDQTLLTKTIKTFWDKYKKKLTKITDYETLQAFVRDHDETVYGQWKKAMKSHRAKIETMRDKLVELVGKQQTMRTKFDFVVANPPYVKQDTNYDKNVFGFNMNDKKYTKIKTNNPQVSIYSTNSKLNLYAYFVYLGVRLMKDGGKLCYITPRSIISKLSLQKTRLYLKEQTHIKKVRDFKNAHLFYERGMKQNFVVGTDSCIVLTEQTKDNQKDTEIIEYVGSKDLLSLEDFHQEKNAIKESYNTLFTSSLAQGHEYVIDMLTREIEKDDDIHYSIYPGIEVKKHANDQGLGYPIFAQRGYYTNKHEIDRFYDFDTLGPAKPSVTGKGKELIVQKLYRITWSSGSYFSATKPFTFTDYKHISNRASFASVGVDKTENLWILYFLFGCLNSAYIQSYIVDEMGGVLTLTNFKLLPIPLIDTDHKRELKQRLIANSEKIITLCKNTPPSYGHLPTTGRTSLTWGDICETAFDPDALGEVIVDVKSSVSFLDTSFQKEAALALAKKINAQPHDPLPDEIVEALGDDVTTDIETLEQERDEIVRALYGV